MQSSFEMIQMAFIIYMHFIVRNRQSCFQVCQVITSKSALCAFPYVGGLSKPSEAEVQMNLILGFKAAKEKSCTALEIRLDKGSQTFLVKCLGLESVQNAHFEENRTSILYNKC